MSHEITTKDSLTLYQKPAWHGLGEIIEDKIDAMTCFDKCGLNWEVKFGEEEATFIGGKEYRQNKYKTLWRIGDPDCIPLGNFTETYKPVQNKQLFELAQEVINIGKKQGEEFFIESAGSIQEGRKVWVLVNQEAASSVNDNDKVLKYLAIANGHDGKMTLGVKPTSVRVVCNNTLSLAFTEKNKKIMSGYLSIAHKGNILMKIEAAKMILKNYYDLSAKFDEAVATMQKKKVTMKLARQLIEEQWRRIFPDKKKEDFYDDYVISSINMLKKEADELNYKEINSWLVANSISGVFQNDIPGGEKAKKNNIENNTLGKLVGWKSWETDNIFREILTKAA